MLVKLTVEKRHVNQNTNSIERSPSRGARCKLSKGNSRYQRNSILQNSLSWQNIRWSRSCSTSFNARPFVAYINNVSTAMSCSSFTAGHTVKRQSLFVQQIHSYQPAPYLEAISCICVIPNPKMRLATLTRDPLNKNLNAI
jgi:hypothetical protein